MLCDNLKIKHNLKAKVTSALLRGGIINQCNIYISKYSIKTLTNIVVPHVQPSMYYKLNTHL